MAAAVSIARYLLDEAATGTAPTTLADDTGNSNTLAINYQTDKAVWTSVAAGNGLDFTNPPITDNSALALLSNVSANGNIGSSYNGVTEASFRLVCDIDAGSASGARVFQIGTTSGNGQLALVEGEFGVSVRIGGSDVVGFPVLSGKGLQVVDCVIDTTQADVNDRVKMWFNGVAQTPSNATTSPSATINCNNASYSLCLGNRESGNRNVDGRIYYFELFTGQLSAQQISDGHTALIASNDSNWVAGNQAPVANDTSYSIFDTAQNNDVVGTFTATDSDGTIASYSITGSTLAIDNAGQITIADNTGITQGVDITATVTATDNLGATDTALITITVTAVVPGIASTTPILLGESVTVTGDGAVDFSAAASLTATYGGVSVTPTGITANTFDFIAPSGGLQLGISHNLVVTADSAVSNPFASSFSPPTGYSVVELTSIGENSFLNDADYTGNAGGDANNIGAGDQFVYENLAGDLSFSATGIPTVTDGATLNANQTINWFYLDAQDTYNAGATATLELIMPVVPVTTDTAAFQATVEAPTGYSVVTLTGIDNDSWLNDPQYIGNAGGDANNVSVGDQILYQNTTIEDSEQVVISSVGLPTMPNATYSTTNQTINWFYLDAQDSYAKSTPEVLTVLPPVEPVDDVAPVLTSPVGTSLGTTTASGSIVTDTAEGVLYYHVSVNSSESANTVKAGVSQPVSALGQITVYTAGLTPNTSYYFHYLQTDAAGNDSVVSSSAVFTTSAERIPISLGTPIPTEIVFLGTNGTYHLAQHVNNPSGTLLLYSVSSGSLNQGVTLNPSTGVLSVTGTTTDEVQSDVYFQVEEVL